MSSTSSKTRNPVKANQKFTIDHNRLHDIKPIAKDYHPIPQDKANPDQFALPLVLPARLEDVRFNKDDFMQVCYVDIRARVQSGLVSLVGLDFVEAVVLTTTPSSQHKRTSTDIISDTTINSRNGLSLQPRGERAYNLLQEAYLSCECAAKLAEDLNESECPNGLIWCCAYTPTGIENNYWIVEASLCHYNMFAISLQMALLQLHAHRLGDTLILHWGNSSPSSEHESQERIKAYLECATRACERHLSYLRDNWVVGFYGNLAELGMIPDSRTLETYFVDIIELLQLDYRIFHIYLPIQAGTAVCERMIDKYLIPTILTKDKIEAGLQRTLLKLLAHVKVAYQKACSVLETCCSITKRRSSDDNGATYEADVYANSLSVRQSYLAFVIKYIAQAPKVYNCLYWILKFNLAVRDIICQSLMFHCYKQLQRIFRDPTFNLMLFGNNDVESLTYTSAENRANEILRERANEMYQMGIKPNGHGISPALERESHRINTAIPGEVYKVDFLFQVWSMRKFAQFNPTLLDTLEFVTRGIDMFMQRVKVKDESLKTSSGVFPTDNELKTMIGQVKIKREPGRYATSKEATSFSEKVQELGRLYLRQREEEEEEEAAANKRIMTEDTDMAQDNPQPTQFKQKKRRERRKQGLDNDNNTVESTQAPVPIAPKAD